MSQLALILGLIVGGGAVLAYRLLVPAPPPLKASLERLYRRDELVRLRDIRAAPSSSTWARRFSSACSASSSPR
jgi:hypothetical protein